MPSTDRFFKQNFRWLLPGVLLTLLSSFGQTFFISLFAGEIRSEFGLSHGDWGGIYLIGTSVSAVVMIWAGVLTDHFRVRVLGALSLAFLAASCIWMAEIRAAWALPFLIFALRFTGQGMLSHIAIVAMARWFVATRGKALSVSALGFSLGQAFIPLVIVSVMSSDNWRNFWWFSAVFACAGIPVLWALLAQERTPRMMSEGKEAAGMQDKHWTRTQTLRHPLFWFMVPAILGPPAFNTAFFFHQVHFAASKGWTHFDLVALFPFFTITSIVAMLISGWALDRLGTAPLLPLSQAPMVAAFIIFYGANSPLQALLGMLLMGISAGALATLFPAFWAEFYGTRHIGSIKAVVAAVMVFGSAIGPAITGVLIDFGIELTQQYLGVAVFFCFTTASMVFGISRENSH